MRPPGITLRARLAADFRQAGRRADPQAPAASLPSSRRRCGGPAGSWRRVGGEAAVVHAAEAFARGHQQIAVARLTDGEDLVAGQAVFGGEHLEAGGIEQPHAEIVKAHPDAAPAVLKDGGRLVARQAVALRVDGEDVVAEAVEAAVHAHPEIALAILEDGAHPIRIVPAIDGGGDEAALFQAAETVVRAGPDVAVAILPERADEGIGQAVARVVPAQAAAGRVHVQPLAAGDPEIVLAVAHQAEGQVAVERRAQHADETLALAPRHAAVAGHPDDVMAVLRHRAHGIERNAGARREVGELAGLETAEIDSGDDPDGAGVIHDAAPRRRRRRARPWWCRCESAGPCSRSGRSPCRSTECRRAPLPAR